nr:NusG domain II-containing protein [Desulfosporosinus sp.]
MLLSIIATGIMTLSKKEDQKSNLVIIVNNKVVKKIPLNKLNESKTYEFNFNENIGYVQVNNGRARMVEMEYKICPKSICSDTGWIQVAYQSIVCLPNQIIVRIEGAKDDEIL